MRNFKNQNSDQTLTEQTRSVTQNSQFVIPNLFRNLLPSRFDDNRETSPTGKTNIDRSRTKFGMTQSGDNNDCNATKNNGMTPTQSRHPEPTIRHSELTTRHPELVSGSKDNDMTNNKRIHYDFREEYNVLQIIRRRLHMTKNENHSSVQFIAPKATFTLAEGGRSSHLRADGCRRCAFTLAEVLITLGIIGVVAAMTLPTLVNKYNEHVTVTKMKKMYSVLSQAYQRYITDSNGGEIFEPSAQGAQDIFDKVIKPYIQVAKVCQPQESGCMFEGDYKLKNQEIDTNHYSQCPYLMSVLLSDGSLLFFKPADINPEIAQISFYYDVNGPKEPNTWGKDLFNFDAKNGLLYPCGDHRNQDTFDDSCAAENSDGRGCSGWVIFKGNMDYLKCPGKLTWGMNKCP